MRVFCQHCNLAFFSDETIDLTCPFCHHGPEVRNYGEEPIKRKRWGLFLRRRPGDDWTDGIFRLIGNLLILKFVFVIWVAALGGIAALIYHLGH
jgi:hypothetical protein